MIQKLVGILGGMGPFASAGFVNTIYEQNSNAGAEQDKPRLILCSDPSIPDRTASIAAAEEAPILRKIISLWETLSGTGIELLIVPCMTSHYYADKFPAEMQRLMVNLVDLTLQEATRSEEVHLLLATSGTYQGGLLTHERIVIPSAADQRRIHDLVYNIKQQGPNAELLEGTLTEVLQLLEQYGADRWICGCTEFHLLTRHVLDQHRELETKILDPLLVIARQWPTYVQADERKEEAIVT